MSPDTTGHGSDEYLSIERLRRMVLDSMQMHVFMQDYRGRD
jgi:hypothetical protein